MASISNALTVLQQLGTAEPRAAWCLDVLGRQTGLMRHLLDDLLDVSRLTVRPAQTADFDASSSRPRSKRGHRNRAALHRRGRSPDDRHDWSWGAAVYRRRPQPTRPSVFQRADQCGKVHPARRPHRTHCSAPGAGRRRHGKRFRHWHRSRESRQHLSDVRASRGRAGLVAGGRGIGLALARSLVMLHGGSMEARSAGLGKGSEFRNSLALQLAYADSSSSRSYRG